MTTATSRAELDRIMRGDTMALSTGSSMWDEWRTWSTTDRKRLARFMGGSFQPDELATELGLTIDEALRAWRSACFVALDNGSSERIDAAEWEAAEACAPIDIYGPDELAELLGVKADTVLTWRKRDRRDGKGRLPEPNMYVSRVPIWLGQRIRDWALEAGRLEECAGF